MATSTEHRCSLIFRGLGLCLRCGPEQCHRREETKHFNTFHIIRHVKTRPSTIFPGMQPSSAIREYRSNAEASILPQEVCDASRGEVVLARGMCPSCRGDLWRHPGGHNRGQGCSWPLVGRAWDAAKHPPNHTQVRDAGLGSDALHGGYCPCPRNPDTCLARLLAAQACPLSPPTPSVTIHPRAIQCGSSPLTELATQSGWLETSHPFPLPHCLL